MTKEITTNIRARKSDILRRMTYIKESRFRITSTSANRAPLFNRFLWKDYSNRIMDVISANAPHIVMRCTGEMLTDALLKSIELLLERNDVLNSSIEKAGGNLCLVNCAKKTVSFSEIVITGTAAGERENEAYRIANELVWKEYDLDNDPLYRVFLIRLSAIEYILGVALHHAIGDSISIGIMLQELLSIYGSVVSGTALRVPPPRLRYMDYLASLESWYESATCEEYIRHYTYKLKSTPVTDLPQKGKCTWNGTISESTAEMKFQLDAGTTRDLKNIAAELKTTLFTVLLAVYKITLWRITGQENLVVVALHAGRLNAGFQCSIGNFAMEVAYKTCLAGNPSFPEIVGRITCAMNEANSQQPVPLDWVRRALAREEISFYAPGINFISCGDVVQARNPLEPGQLIFTPPGVRHGCHGFHVSCTVEFRYTDGVIIGSIVYKSDLYDESTIRAFINCFIQMTSEVIGEKR